MSNRLLWGVAVVVVIVLAGMWLRDDTPREVRAGEYYDASQEYAIIPPPNWTKEVENDADGKMVMFFSPLEGSNDQFRETINVVVERLPYRMSLDKYVEISNQNASREIPGIKIGRSTLTTINGRDAMREECTFRMNGVKLKSLVYVFVVGRRAYAISCGAEPHTYDRYLPLFEEVCGTFEVE